jgi:hypothetical protein
LIENAFEEDSIGVRPHEQRLLDIERYLHSLNIRNLHNDFIDDQQSPVDREYIAE